MNKNPHTAYPIVVKRVRANLSPSGPVLPSIAPRTSETMALHIVEQVRIRPDCIARSRGVVTFSASTIPMGR